LLLAIKIYFLLKKVEIITLYSSIYSLIYKLKIAMTLLVTLAENPVYKLNLETPDDEKLIELYHRAQNFDSQNNYLNFCLKNLKYIDQIFKFAPFDKIIELFTNTNLLSNYMSKDFINDIIGYHQKEFLVSKQKPQILLNDKFSVQYNFNMNVYQKRLDKLLPDSIKSNEFIFGENMIYDICHNETYKKVVQNQDQTFYWMIYPQKEIHFQISNEKYGYNYTVKHKNIVFVIQCKSYDFDTTLNNNLFCGDQKNISTSPLGYHLLASNQYVSKDLELGQKIENPHSFSRIGKIKQDNIIHFDPNIHYRCYICKHTCNKGHHLQSYKFMCCKCGVDNYTIENEVENMEGMTAFVTGIRHTIGYAIALKLLRSGCTVIGTTRFPMCALHNYQQEEDYDVWKERLTLCQCDFLNIESVKKTIELVKTFKLNIIINNACQTVRPTKGYYQRVTGIENSFTEAFKVIKDKEPSNGKNNQLSIVKCNNNQIINVGDTLYYNQVWTRINNIPKIQTDIVVPVNFTRNIKDPDLDPYNNSWTLSLQDVGMAELLEVNAINQIVPTMIIKELMDHMQTPSFVIQVSAKEGIFNSNKSTERGVHPHTNMCKSGMNMLIRTLSETRIPGHYFYAVDPGYVSGAKDKDYPLSINDGAQRVIYPVISYLKGKILQQGHWKNYELHNW
jgi:NAD(P)-dependent dehydrogenase (short-subunit alcohol dehydrogenase family)